MPGYIGYRPQFDPISLQEYLTVPAMIVEGRKREADTIEQYQDEAEKWRSLMGDSPEAKSIWADFDNTLNSLGDDILNNKTGDLARAARKLRNSYRDIKYKAEDAADRRNKDLDRQAKNPNLIGTIGDFMTYYNNPDYSTPMFDGSEIQKNLDAVSKNIASNLTPKRLGYVDDETKHDIMYSVGFTPEQKSALIYDALSGNPQTNEGKMLRSSLEGSGLDLTNPDMIRQAYKFIDAGTRALDIHGFTSTDPNFRTAGQRISDASAQLDLNQKRENYNRYGSATVPTGAVEDYNFVNVDGYDLYERNEDGTAKKDKNGNKVINAKNREIFEKGLTVVPKGNNRVQITRWDPKKKKWVAVKTYKVNDDSKEIASETAGGMFYRPTEQNSSKGYVSLNMIKNYKGKNVDNENIPLNELNNLTRIGSYTDENGTRHASTQTIHYFQDSEGNVYEAIYSNSAVNEAQSNFDL